MRKTKIFHYARAAFLSLPLLANLQAEHKLQTPDYGSMRGDTSVTSPNYDMDYENTEFYITLDYTYWIAQPGQIGTVYNTNPKQPNPLLGGNGARGYVGFAEQTPFLFPDYKMRSGFKLGAGTYLDKPSLQIYGEYTLFYNKQDHGKYKKLPITSTNYYFQDMKNYYANIFQRFDAVLRRKLNLGKQLTATPSAGLLFAIDEQWIGAILKKPAPNNPFGDGYLYSQDNINQQNWWGLGPYISIDTEAYLLRDSSPVHLAFTFHGGSALPWSKYDWNYFMTYPNTPKGEGLAQLTGTNVRDRLWALSPMIEMSLGLKWETVWGKDQKKSFSLKAAWENQIWLSHTYISSDQQALTNAQNYTMQGLTVSGKICF